MYKGNARFTKEQVIFMAQVIIAAAVDRVESACPPCTPANEWEPRGDELRTWCRAVTETAGMGLAVLYAQLSGDGLAICDAIAIIDLDKELDHFIDARILDQDYPEPDTRKLAEKFVNKAFGGPWFADV
jgi:hypothetical protein